MIAASVPDLRSYRESQRLQSATEVVAAAVSEAKSRARSLNVSVIVEYRLDEGTIAVIDDADGDGVEDSGERDVPPKRVRISSGTGQVAVRGVENVGDEDRTARLAISLRKFSRRSALPRAAPA